MADYTAYLWQSNQNMALAYNEKLVIISDFAFNIFIDLQLYFWD